MMMRISKIVGIASLFWLISCGSEEAVTTEGFVGTITIIQSTDLSDAPDFYTQMMGDDQPEIMDQVQTLHIDVPNSRFFMSTKSNLNVDQMPMNLGFTSMIMDLKNRKMMLINEEEKSYVQMPDVEDMFTEKIPLDLPMDINQLAKLIVKSDEQKDILGYSCNRYEINFPMFQIEQMYLSQELFEEISPMLGELPMFTNIKKNFDDIGWPMLLEMNMMGIKTSIKTTSVEKKKLDEKLFDLDGYTEFPYAKYTRLTMEAASKLGEGKNPFEVIDSTAITEIMETMESSVDELKDLLNNF